MNGNAPVWSSVVCRIPHSDQIELQNDLYALCRWSKYLLLIFNVKKCKVLHIWHVNFDFEYQMYNKNDTYIKSITEDEDEEKDLRIHYTSTLIVFDYE